MTRNHKPYIEIRGIPSVLPIPVTVDGHKLKITSLCIYPRSGMDVVTCEPVKIKGKSCEAIRVDIRPEIRTLIEQANTRYEAAFESRYPGVYELVMAIDAEANYRESFNRMMEDGDNDGVNPPRQPRVSVKEAHAKYPIASAYLTILSYANSNPASQVGYNKRCAGEAALKAIESGADVITARDEMIESYNAIPVEDRS